MSWLAAWTEMPAAVCEAADASEDCDEEGVRLREGCLVDREGAVAVVDGAAAK